MNRHPPELLAPAGDWEALRAAVANGADAVYFGLSNFNARFRATNFTLEELPAVMDYLHAHNVRGYVAFNTLVFSDELPHAVAFLTVIAAAGADAVIVQDLGLVRLIKRLAPGLPVHGSTQMTLTEPWGIEFVKRLGVERVILARELSVADIGRIAAATEMPLEVFVHGALCVAYSGQCLTSEALGGRSANRGQCAQACRLQYEMLVDGQPRELGDRAYLLSPQDLAAYDLIDPLVKLGVSCFKIEGRLKSAAYVAATTQTYRAALSAALAQESFVLSRQGQLDLAQSFSRGLTHGFLDGVNHQLLVQGRFPKSRGVRVGTVVGKTARGLLVKLADEQVRQLVKPGDGVVFDEGHPDQDEQGGRVWAVETSSVGPATLELVFDRGAVNLAAVAEGAIVWKTDDPALRKRLEQSYSRDLVTKRLPVVFRVAGRIGEPLRVTLRIVADAARAGQSAEKSGSGIRQTSDAGSLATSATTRGDGGIRHEDAAGHQVEVAWPGPLEAARKHPLTIEVLREQLGRLGDTPYELAGIEADLSEPIMVPKSVLNDLRRQAVERLNELRSTGLRPAIADPRALEHLRSQAASVKTTTRSGIRQNSDAGSLATSATTQWYVLARTAEQLSAVLTWQPPAPLAKPDMVYCDFEDPRRYRDAVSEAKDAGMPVGVATMRIMKPGEETFLARIAECGADGVLVRNLAALSYFRQHLPRAALVGDFSLNIANEITADLFAGEGCQRMVPSYDLNWEQLTALLGRTDPGLFELVIHQHMPMFHMEHCVFAAFLSTGKDFTDCGRPCDRHRVELRDRVGAEFPVVADAGCRNTVFNSVPQSAAEYVPRMQALGIRHFRVELLRETPADVGPLLERYARVLAGLDAGRRAWRGLQVLNQLGVTRGTLESV